MTSLLGVLHTQVSTHSRLKAAGFQQFRRSRLRRSFNTQPPEGGWRSVERDTSRQTGFNTQPPEGGWTQGKIPKGNYHVSTHSRLKAAGC